MPLALQPRRSSSSFSFLTLPSSPPGPVVATAFLVRRNLLPSLFRGFAGRVDFRCVVAGYLLVPGYLLANSELRGEKHASAAIPAPCSVCIALRPFGDGEPPTASRLVAGPRAGCRNRISYAWDPVSGQSPVFVSATLSSRLFLSSSFFISLRVVFWSHMSYHDNE
ncbi:hypothetical protein C8R43DRAFT_1013298 [Mycena crocata]|nr:hypothetical protein C8R43DRAFT_1013298 [Mycena crocata]